MCWDPLYPATFPPPGGPLALGFCLRVVRCGSLVGMCLPSDFLPVLCGPGGVAGSGAGACAGLAARLGATRHVPGSWRIGWVGHHGMGFPARVIPLWPCGPGCCWEDAPGCRTVPRPRWDMRLQGCLGSRIARWFHPQLLGDGSAWLGWQGTARCLPGRGESAPQQHWQKALGLFGARGGHKGVRGATPAPEQGR